MKARRATSIPERTASLYLLLFTLTLPSLDNLDKLFNNSHIR